MSRSQKHGSLSEEFVGVKVGATDCLFPCYSYDISNFMDKSISNLISLLLNSEFEDRICNHSHQIGLRFEKWDFPKTRRH